MRAKNEERITEIEKFINDYFDRYGTSPTQRDIAASVGTSVSNVNNYLTEMQNRGLISLDGHRKIHTKRMSRDLEDLSRTTAPIVGTVACGEPLYSEEFIEDSVRLPKSLFGQGPFFILRASGLSMIDAGIEPGDLVVIRQTNTANEGDIVVALTDEGTTLKRYYPEPEKKRIRLQPENRTMQPIYCGSVTIQGVAIRIIRNIERQSF